MARATMVAWGKCSRARRTMSSCASGLSRARIRIRADSAADPGSDQISLAEADPDIGEEINEVCAGCHGEYGQGGSDGEYPRLAGLPAAFIAQQLLLFRDRSRTNLAMVEYVDHRQMPDKDIASISVYLAAFNREEIRDIFAFVSTLDD